MKAKMVYVAAVLALVFSLTAVIMPANPAMADPITVTNTDDTGIGSLRWAIANAIPGETIDFTITGTITLASQLTINKSLTITGPGEANLAISGNNTSRVFHINGSYTVDMSGMTIRNGNTTADGGGLYNDGGNVTMTSCAVSDNTAQAGGGLYNNVGNVTMTSCTVSDNEAVDDGGGMYNYRGNVTMTSCTISGNEGGLGTGQDGGGICNTEGILTMTSCTVSGNDAGNAGGGIHNNQGDVMMTDCTVSGNTADYGGGIFNSSMLTMTNCTISGNTAEEGDTGGGIHNNDELTMINCTISDNTAEGVDSGGGIYNSAEVGNVTMTCTIVWGNIADPAPNIYGLYTDIGGESIVDEPLGTAPNPLLGPLQDNGGPTFTHALLTGSPAIDTCVNECTVDTDQRGQPRPIDGDLDGSAFCDVGAYEKQILAVGGIVEPVDRLSLLAPWLGLAAFISMALAVVVIMKRRRLA